jgi:hypothetical protein
MSFFKNILIDAEDCGINGLNANEAYVFLKSKYSSVDFGGEDFNLNGVVFDSYLNGRAEFEEDNENCSPLFESDGV